MAKQTYAEKLKDPRWQRKRLEIMQRDDFTCTQCGDKTSTLHVHHKRYTNINPWEYAQSDLSTLCESCHKLAHFEIIMIEEGILKVSDFVKKYPEVTTLFKKIKNHEGVWDLFLHDKARFVFPDSSYSDYQIKILDAVIKLKEFIGEVDQHIFIVSEMDGYYMCDDRICEKSFGNNTLDEINFYDLF